MTMRYRKFRTGIAVALIALLMFGCSGPFWQFPGGALLGPEQELNSAQIPAEGGVMQLETNPDEPYSVNVGYVVIGGSAYIDPAESRRWYQNIKSNALVRVRFSGSDVVYTAVAVAEVDPEVLGRFEADRHVLRIAPRQVNP